MSAQQDVSQAVPGSEFNRALEQEVVRRAGQLCRRAEPHTDQPPCTAHRNEARRQVLGPAG